jgi:hypothetical protein
VDHSTAIRSRSDRRGDGEQPVARASVGPVELRLGHADGTAVCLGFLASGLVAVRVAEDLAGEDHGRFGVAVPVRIPAGAQQAVGQFAGQRVAAGRGARIAPRMMAPVSGPCSMRSSLATRSDIPRRLRSAGRPG